MEKSLHKFEINIEGYNRSEAELKLKLLMGFGEFTWDMDSDKLAGSVFSYWLFCRGIKALLKKNAAIQIQEIPTSKKIPFEDFLKSRPKTESEIKK
jgi:hypothetical protein